MVLTTTAIKKTGVLKKNIHRLWRGMDPTGRYLSYQIFNKKTDLTANNSQTDHRKYRCFW
ncbi:hypothetical protein D6J04_03680 [Legionella taurinensis]|uniref:Uncharacterized protein n=1 Tax=Legionella taurinensis TaxID=70611 RepID=A0A3A5LME6_9GAMM|nr:hypothetical protein D6J04_03680 [Legionella taurinensis]RJT69127.1 hypothetical protein D6J03_03535 [Legionella taurinensis]